MTDRCPNCSFDPTSASDYCDEHRPRKRRTVAKERADAVAFLRNMKVGGTNGLIDAIIHEALEHVAERIHSGEHEGASG